MKIFRKISSCFIIAVLFFAMISVTAAEAASSSVYFYDDFSTDRSSGALNGYWKNADSTNSTWQTVSYEGVSVDAVNGWLSLGGIADGREVLQIQENGTRLKGDMTISFQFRLEQLDEVYMLYRSMYDMNGTGKFFGPWLNIKRDATDGNYYLNTVSGGGKWTQYSTARVEEKKWYPVTMKVDSDSNSYQLVFDGDVLDGNCEFFYDGGTLLEGTEYALIRPLMFYVLPESTAVVNYDNLSIAEGVYESYPKEDVYFHDDFSIDRSSGVKDGTWKKEDGATESTLVTGSYSGVRVDTEKGYLQLGDGGNSIAKIQMIENGNKLTGDCTISFRFKMEELSQVYVLYRAQYLGYKADNSAFSFGPWIGIAESGGSYYLNTVTGGGGMTALTNAKLTADFWHSITMNVDAENATYELLLDDQLIHSEVRFKFDYQMEYTTTYQLYRPLMFNSWDWANGSSESDATKYGTVYYDDVTILRANFETDQPEEEESGDYFSDDFTSDRSSGALNAYWKKIDGVTNSTLQTVSYQAVSVKDGYLQIGDGTLEGKLQMLETGSEKKGDITVKFCFKMDTPAEVPVLYRAMYKMVDSANATKMFGPYLAVLENNGSYYVNSASFGGTYTSYSAAEVKPGEWNTVELRVDTANDTYALLVNNRLVDESADFQYDGGKKLTTAYGLSRPLQFYTQTAAVCYDDIKITEGITASGGASNDEIYDEALTLPAPLSQLEGWTDENGNATVVLDPAADCDQAILLPEGSTVYRTVTDQRGIINAECYCYLKSDSVVDIWLADADGIKIAGVTLDSYQVRSLNQSGSPLLTTSVSYPEKSWVSLQLNADMFLRTVDVMLNGKKINTAPLDFYDTTSPEDSGFVGRIGFTCRSSEVWLDDISVSGVVTGEALQLMQVRFTDENGRAAKVALPGGSVTGIDLNSNFSGKDYVAYAAIYDENNRLLAVDGSETAHLAEGNLTANFENLSIPSDWDGEVKTFVWGGDALLTPILSKANQTFVRVVIAGDSMAADCGWGTRLSELFDENVSVINLSQAEICSSEYLSEGYLAKAEDRLFPGDYLLVSTAIGDAEATLSKEVYQENLLSYLEAAKRSGATCIFVTSPAAYDGVDIASYTAWMKEVALEQDVLLIDLAASWDSLLQKAENPSVYYGCPLSSAGASYMAQEIAEEIGQFELPIAENIVDSEISYNISGNVLKITGTGKMPVYASFTDTPWSDASGILAVSVAEGVTSISTNAFSGFTNLLYTNLPRSVTEIQTGAFPSGISFDIYGYLNTAAHRFSEQSDKLNFYLRELKILTIGNSHTADYTEYRDLIFNDLATAGMKTQVYVDRIIRGGHCMYYPMSLDTSGDTGHYNTHYIHGTDPDCLYASTYAMLDKNEYDLVVIQDYWESAVGRTNFEEGIAKTMRWLRDRQPTAEIAWVVDWTEVNSAGGRPNIRSAFEKNTVTAMNTVDNMREDAPDYYIPMGTALQNARTSYLNDTYNYVGCFTSTGTTDWAQTDIGNFNVLERDITHTSFELGRYLVGVAAFGKIFDTYDDILWKTSDYNYFEALNTNPDSSKNSWIGPWKGEVTENIRAIINESAKNAIQMPKEVTQSVYTVDPANAIAEQVSALEYPTFTASGIAATVNEAGLGITVSASDVMVNGTTATVTFVYGYTRKIVTVEAQ